MILKVSMCLDAMPDGWSGMDIGSLTIENFQRLLKAKTIVWNDPWEF